MAFQPPIAFAHSPLLPSFLQSQNSPPILTVLQAHSRLKNVQTLTTSLQPVVHPAFGLRFVRLEEGSVGIPDGAEDKDAWVDWIGGRVGELKVDETDGEDMAWLRGQRCLEACAGLEGCVALLLIASTSDPSPLAALQQLHTTTRPFSDSRALLVFYLVITQSPADPTLLPSLQRAFGPHTGVLSLPTPLPTDTIINVPAPLPVPPPLHSRVSLDTPSLHRPLIDNTPAATPAFLQREEYFGQAAEARPAGQEEEEEEGEAKAPPAKVPTTIASSVSQAWHRFLREFVTQSLVPYMERSVLALHESYTSRRALPTRLLSLTSRRFFSSSAPATPSTTPKSTASGTTSLVGTKAGDRRLVEWAAMLGDTKEVAAVGDGIRREGPGIEDVLLLHAIIYPPPSPSSSSSQPLPSLTPLAAIALRPPTPATAASLLSRALLAARIDYQLVMRSRDGSGIAAMPYARRAEVARWMVLAAGNAEEPLAALLLGRAGQWEPARRRKAMWYALAGGRMERCGLKPIALLYLRQSYRLYTSPSPSSVSSLATADRPVHCLTTETPLKSGFPVPTSIPRSLGRLLYTTHETQGAVRVFLDLLGERYASSNEEDLQGEGKDDEVLLEDFRLSYQTLRDNDGASPELTLPGAESWIVRAEVRTDYQRVPEDGLLSTWETFSKSMGRTERGRANRASVGRPVSVDVTVRNPLRCDVSLGSVSLVVRGKADDDNVDDIQVDTMEEARLPAGEERVISMALTCPRILSLIISHITFNFLDLLPVTLPLSSTARRRLHDTPQQLHTPTYAPPSLLILDFGESTPLVDLDLTFDENEEEQMTLATGEWRRGTLTIANVADLAVDEIWIVPPATGKLWIDLKEEDAATPTAAASSRTETLTSPNTLLPPSPLRLPLAKLHTSSELGPKDALELSVILHGQAEGLQELGILVAFRPNATSAFHLARLTHRYEVKRLLEVATRIKPSKGEDRAYMLSLEVENIGSLQQVQVDQVSFVNSRWQLDTHPDLANLFKPMDAGAVASADLGIRKADAYDREGSEAPAKFLAEKLQGVLDGREVGSDLPLPVQLVHSHVSSTASYSSPSSPHIQYFQDSAVRNVSLHTLSKQFPLIPSRSYPYIFPLHIPRTAWVALFFSIPSSRRSGCLMLGGLTLEAGEKLVDAEGVAKAVDAEKAGKPAVRSMYAETVREKEELAGAVMASGWAKEENPLVVDVGVNEGEEIQHDFEQGPCKLHVHFTLRNFSSSRTARFTLRLPSSIAGTSAAPPCFPPPYTGILTHRGTLEPMSSCTKAAKLSIARDGLYTLGGWRMEVEVGDGLARFVHEGHDGVVRVLKV